MLRAIIVGWRLIGVTLQRHGSAENVTKRQRVPCSPSHFAAAGQQHDLKHDGFQQDDGSFTCFTCRDFCKLQKGLLLTFQYMHVSPAQGSKIIRMHHQLHTIVATRGMQLSSTMMWPMLLRDSMPAHAANSCDTATIVLQAVLCTQTIPQSVFDSLNAVSSIGPHVFPVLHVIRYLWHCIQIEGHSM